MDQRPWWQREWLAMSALVVIALAPRLAPSGGFMDIDSATFWLVRIKSFLAGLQSSDVGNLVVSFHPGVPLLWLGSLSEWYLQTTTWWRATADPVVTYLQIMKLPVLVATSLMPALLYRTLKPVMPRGLAWWMSLMMAIDASWLVFSRYLHLDALLVGYTFLGLASLWRARDGSRRWAALTGVWLMLATLTRVNGVVGLLYALVMVFVIGRGTWRVVGRQAITIVLGAVLTAVVVWPPVLFTPARVIGVSDATLSLLFHEHEVPPRVDVQPLTRSLLYPLFILDHETTVALALAIVGLVTSLVVYRRQPWAKWVGIVLGYAVLYWLLLMVVPKKIDRYILPATTSVMVLAGVGAWWLWSWRRIVGRSLVTITLIVQMVMVWRLAPYFQSYESTVGRWLAKPFGTSAVYHRAWGEGMREAVAYLRRSDGSLPSVASWFAGAFCVYAGDRGSYSYPLSSEPYVLCPSDLRLLSDAHGADYLILSRDQVSQRIYGQLLDDLAARQQVPIHTITIHGQPWLWIYRNPGGLRDHYDL